MAMPLDNNGGEHQIVENILAEDIHEDIHDDARTIAGDRDEPHYPRLIVPKPSLPYSLATTFGTTTIASESVPALPTLDLNKYKQDVEKPDIELEGGEAFRDAKKVDEIAPPPDGGIRAWMTVLGASFVAFSTFGLVNAYGAFSDFYRANYLSDDSPTLVSMIGSIQVFVLYVCAAFVGPIFDAFGPKYLIPMSGLIVTFSLFMLSLVQPHHIWQQYLCQSVLFNVGAAFGYLPSLSIIPHWFQKKTAYAMGIVLGTASFGGIVIPIMLHKLIPRIGFGWTVRILAFITLFSYTIASLTIRSRRPRRPLPRLSKFFDIQAFKDPRYSLFVAGAWLTIVSVFNPFFQVGAYGVASHGADPLTPYLLTIMSATAIVGRVLPGHLADKVGRFNTIAVSTMISSILTLTLWYTSTAEVNIVVFAALYGFASGPFFSLLPACVAQISPVERVGARIGMLFATLSFGALAGTPIGGVFIKETTVANFRHLILYTGVLGLAGSAFLFAARYKCDSRLRAIV